MPFIKKNKVMYAACRKRNAAGDSHTKCIMPVSGKRRMFFLICGLWTLHRHKSIYVYIAWMQKRKSMGTATNSRWEWGGGKGRVGEHNCVKVSYHNPALCTMIIDNAFELNN